MGKQFGFSERQAIDILDMQLRQLTRLSRIDLETEQKDVQARIDTFLTHNPSVSKAQIPSELVTASGSGLDPHLSPQGALIQVPRIAKSRSISEDKLRDLVDKQTSKPIIGMPTINILSLNLALDALK